MYEPRRILKYPVDSPKEFETIKLNLPPTTKEDINKEVEALKEKFPDTEFAIMSIVVQ